MKNSPGILNFSILLYLLSITATADTLSDKLEQQAAEVEHKVITWRHDIHQHPELGNREFRTAALVAKHLRKLGLEVQEKNCPYGCGGHFAWL